MKIFLPVIMFFSLGATNCGPTIKQYPVVQGLIDCTTVDLGKNVVEIGLTVFQDVKVIIEAGRDGWQNALTDIALKYGNDTLACALKATYTALTAHPANVRPLPPSAEALRAQHAMSDRGYTFK